MVDLNLYNNAASLIDAGSADYRQRLVALQAQQNAASAAAQAAAQQGGTNRAKQYADSVAGGMNDLRNTGGAGMFGGALQTQQSLNAAGIADQGARTAQHLAEAGSVINTSFNDRLAGASTIQAQSKDTLAHDFYSLAAQQAAATKSSGGSGGGGGGGGRGGHGGGGGGSGGLSYTDASRIQSAEGRNWTNEALLRYEGKQGGNGFNNFVSKSGITNADPGNAAYAQQQAFKQWDINKAKGIKNGFARREIRHVFGQLKSDFGAYNTEQRKMQLLRALGY